MLLIECIIIALLVMGSTPKVKVVLGPI